MLRSAGFEILARPEEEVYVCRRTELNLEDWDHRAVYPSHGREPNVGGDDIDSSS